MTQAGYSTNYTGRSLDLSIITQIPPNDSTPVSLHLANPAQVVAGPQKAVQNWMIAFLTQKGSVLADPTFGTTFMSQLNQNVLQDDLAIAQAFSLAAKDLRTYFLTHATGNELPDEVITSANLLPGWGLENHTLLNLIVGLTLQSGTVTTVLVPVLLADV